MNKDEKHFTLLLSKKFFPFGEFSLAIDKHKNHYSETSLSDKEIQTTIHHNVNNNSATTTVVGNHLLHYLNPRIAVNTVLKLPQIIFNKDKRIKINFLG